MRFATSVFVCCLPLGGNKFASSSTSFAVMITKISRMRIWCRAVAAVVIKSGNIDERLSYRIGQMLDNKLDFVQI